jgi:hypothetical protein
MKIYQTDVNMQNLGSSFLIILRGKAEDIQQTFNSFYNLCGVNEGAKLEVNDGAAIAIGTFWTNAALLRRYWQNRWILSHPNCKENKVYGEQDGAANEFVKSTILEMRKSAEAFMRFDGESSHDSYQIGQISAERPDENFSEQVASYISKTQPNE